MATTNADVTIKVSATDTGGNSVVGTFPATVTNTEPTAVGNIPGQKAVIGETAQLTLTPYFTDTETSDANLTFSASSSDTAVVKTPTINSTSKVMTLEVPDTATDKATAVIIVTATDESGKTATQAFIATVESRPAFAASAYSADLAEIKDGSSTAVPLLITDNQPIPEDDLTVSGSTDAKTFELVSVNGEGKDDGGTDYGKFAVAAKTGAEATTAVVTYKGAGEDYETLKAASTPDEPTFVLVISVTDDTNMLEATDTATLTVTVTDANEAPTFASQTPVSPRLLEGLAGNDADNTPNTNDDPRLLATLTFADENASDTSLAYSVVSVAPSSLGGTNFGNFSVAAKSGSPLQAELSFVGDATVVDYGTDPGEVQSFTVTVRAADDESAYVDRTVTVAVVDNLPPAVSIVTVSTAMDGAPTLVAESPLNLEANAYDAEIADGDVLTYSWSVTSATSVAGATGDEVAAVGNITLNTPTAASTSLKCPATSQPAPLTTFRWR